ncbi:MAG: amino acid ABC transporter substrate-binding protein [Cyanobium sp. CZS 25K]|nr:amino acid ABC transporter substrate-binding protein [Cyanobium sp. CZS25K]
MTHPARVLSTTALLLTALVALLGCAAGGGAPGSPTMARIRERGRLVCAVDGAVPGFSTVGPQGAFVGIDADFCRAVAAAVLGDARKVEFRPVTAGERFVALSSGEVDLLSISSTHTLGRDAPGGNALSFGPVFFYDGQGVMVPAASGIRSLRDLAGKPICVESGTNTELNLADRMRERGVAYQPLRFQSGEQAYPAYEQGRCAAITSDSSLLAGKRSGFRNPADHVLLSELLSKEPSAKVTIQADPAWADAVRWITYTLIQAEESGLTQANVEASRAAARADASQAERRRFLGVEGDFGRQLGLPADFTLRVVKAVGNYGELFERHLGQSTPLGLDRGLNRLWNRGGLHIAPPFR